MKTYCKEKDFKLYHGSMLDMLQVITPCSVDSIVTDPPYELNFMGKGWDNLGIAFQKETWEKCYAVLKDGGYLLAFGGSRTFHRIACAIEDAGFEIRDTIMWLYGSGFPKSMNISKQIDKRDENDYSDDLAKQWEGWGTTLKPAYEPIIVARKPFKGSLVDNVMKNGVGGINIDECRIGNEERTYKGMSAQKPEGAGCFRDDNWKPKEIEKTVTGRFPSNVILTYDDSDFQEVCGGLPIGGKNGRITKHYKKNNQVYGEYGECNTWDAYNDSGSAARYFYCAKAGKKDRDEGLDAFVEKIDCDRNEECYSADVPFNRSANARKNTHPTVKPTDLMQYLVRLVTPDGGVVLDPFNGSGSTGKAVMWENRDHDKDYKYIGIELTEEYLPIAEARIKYVTNKETDVEEEKQLNFDFDDYCNLRIN